METLLAERRAKNTDVNLLEELNLSDLFNLIMWFSRIIPDWIFYGNWGWLRIDKSHSRDDNVCIKSNIF